MKVGTLLMKAFNIEGYDCDLVSPYGDTSSKMITDYVNISLI